MARSVDKRSDIWAFGCVLYEMLAGKQAFSGATMTDTLAAIVGREPDWAALPATMPPAVRRLLRRCLTKERKLRLHDIADARLEIEDVRDGGSLTSAETPVVLPRYWPVRLPWLVATSLVGLLAVGALTWRVWRAPQAEAAPPRVSRFTIAPSGTTSLSIDGNDRDLVITPDGTRVVYVGNKGTQLFVRPLEQLDPTAIATGTGLRAVSVSPDGQWAGFVDTNATLKRVAIAGGPSMTIVQMDAASRGTTWGPDNTIIFGTGAIMTGLQRVPATGGAVTVLTKPASERGERDHLWPEMLPGGRAVLFTITAATGGFEASQVAVLDLETGTYQVLVPGGNHAHYVPTPGGHLVYWVGGTLRAVQFDLARLQTRGTPVTVLPGVVTTQFGAADFDVAADGTLVYVDAPGATSTALRTLVWVDRLGREELLAAPARPYLFPRVSPDGARVAVVRTDEGNDIWVFDLARPQTLTRLTTDPAADRWPVWTKDGQRLVFASTRAGAINLFEQAADGTGATERLTQSMNQQGSTDVSLDGELIFHEVTPMMGRDLMRLSLDVTHRVQTLLQTAFEERNGLVSPDGRWLVYESNSSGRFEVYVRPFPNASAGPAIQISPAGGTRPVWARSGHELFFVAQDGALMAVRVDARGGSTWSAGTPTKLFDSRHFAGVADFGRNYDVAPDGRFLMIKEAGADQSSALPHIVVVQHWFEDLKRLVPATR